MDDRRFDRLARTVAAGGTRRAALRLLGGGVIAALARLGFPADEAAALDRDASCRGSCDQCTKDGQCCSGRCREGQCRCKERGSCKVDRACCSGQCRRDGTCKPAAAVACGTGEPSDGEDCVPRDAACIPSGTPCCNGDECVGDTALGGVCRPPCDGGTTRCGDVCLPYCELGAPHESGCEECVCPPNTTGCTLGTGGYAKPNTCCAADRQCCRQGLIGDPSTVNICCEPGQVCCRLDVADPPGNSTGVCCDSCATPDGTGCAPAA